MRDPASERWKPFGTHLHRFEPPDLYIVRIRGNVLSDDMRVQLETLRSLGTRTDNGIFWIADVSAMATLTSEARRAVVDKQYEDVRPILRGSAVVGASFTTRVVATLLIRAVRALKADKFRPVAFVQTETEARTFLDEYRRRGARLSVAP